MSMGISVSIRRSTRAFLVVLCAVSTFAADSILFPSPLHLTREVRDPVSDTVTVIDEYYQGNRVVSVRGLVTSIADYEKGELTEIDRARGVYSISRFDEVARALTIGAQRSAVASQRNESPALEMRSAAPRQQAGRMADVVEVEQSEPPAIRATIAVDREIVLSRDAFDVVTGAAYPNLPSREHQMIAAAARQTSRTTVAKAMSQRIEEYRLPLEQAISYTLDGELLQFRSTVTAVDRELPPPDLLTIPRGAQRVEGAWVQRARMLEQLNR